VYDGPIATKCGPTADHNYAIFYYCMVLTIAVLLIICEMYFAYIG